MNEEKVKEMLRRYFDGTSALKEEDLLRRYFAQGDIPDALKKYQPLFAFFTEERAVEPPESKKTDRRIRLYASIITGIAASIAILFLWGLPNLKSDNYVYYLNGERVYNEEIALQVAENKLQIMADSWQKINNSMASLEKLQESSQTLLQLNKISDAYRKIELKIEN